MKIKAIERAQLFSWNHILDTLFDRYKNLIDQTIHVPGLRVSAIAKRSFIPGRNRRLKAIAQKQLHS